MTTRIFIFLVILKNIVCQSLWIRIKKDSYVLKNVSKGLEYDHLNFHQCQSDQNNLDDNRNLDITLKYTSNRKPLSSRSSSSLSTVILALGAHSSQPNYNYGPYGSLNGLMSVWDSWIENYFSYTSNNTLLTMILDERDFLLQNYTNNKEDYLDTVLIKNMGCEKVSCVHELKHILNQSTNFKNNKKLCQNENYLNLDQGYYIYYFDFKKLNLSSFQKPLIIFASIYKFPKPKWAENEDEENLFIHWRPRRLNKRYPTNYGYVKMTNWYSHHMFNLKILDYFDFGIKLDNDVSFVSPYPVYNIPKQMIDLNSKILMTTKEWYSDDPRICQGIEFCISQYLISETSFCKKRFNKKNEINFIPGGKNYSVFWEGKFEMTFRSHYTIFSLDFYSSPEVLNFGKYWNDFDPYGMWDFRWGDQQFWPRPIQLFGSGNLSKDIFHFDKIDSDNELFVVHKLQPRQNTVLTVNYFSVYGSTKESRDDIFKNAIK